MLWELPISLNDTYERILKEIKDSNRTLARRVLQCLVVAIRPPSVAGLAELLAVDFDDVEGIPRLKPDWRWEEQEPALMSACSSLIAIVQAGGSRVVQFSQFSVKEFLTSPRLATASGEVSNYHIDLEPGHTILTQACLGVLLQIQDAVDGHTRKGQSDRGELGRSKIEGWFGPGLPEVGLNETVCMNVLVNSCASTSNQQLNVCSTLQGRVTCGGRRSGECRT
jgi:hypothetical protein